VGQKKLVAFRSPCAAFHAKALLARTHSFLAIGSFRPSFFFSSLFTFFVSPQLGSRWGKRERGKRLLALVLAQEVHVCIYVLLVRSVLVVPCVAAAAGSFFVDGGTCACVCIAACCVFRHEARGGKKTEGLCCFSVQSLSCSPAIDVAVVGSIFLLRKILLQQPPRVLRQIIKNSIQSFSRFRLRLAVIKKKMII
jgi:hypothetical protein